MGAIVIRTRYDEGTESAEVATSGGCEADPLKRIFATVCICIWYVVEPNYGFYTTVRKSADGGLYWR